MDHPVIGDLPAEWRPSDKAWDLFTPPAMEAKLRREIAAESEETPPNFSVDGYITIEDIPAYAIICITATGQSHRLARQELIPGTNFTITDFYSTGPHFKVVISDGGGRCFTIPADHDSNASAAPCGMFE